MRVRDKIIPEIAEEQCGVVEGKDTTNAKCIPRTLIERAVESQKEVRLSFIGKLWHLTDEIITQLIQLEITG